MMKIMLGRSFDFGWLKPVLTGSQRMKHAKDILIMGFGGLQ